MLEIIVSGGQTGADQGGLDAAIKYGIAHGGWIPQGRKTENGILPPYYQLKEMPSDKYHERTKQNVIDSHGTVIFYHDELTGGSKYTEEMALSLKKPFLSLNLSRMPAFQSINQITSWILKKHIAILNVAGSRASKDPKIYSAVKFIISCVILLSAVNKITKPRDLSYYPKTLDGAIDRIIGVLPHTDKVVISDMAPEDLEPVYAAFGGLIRFELGLDDESRPTNTNLIKSCRREAKETGMGQNIPFIVVHGIWKKLRKK